jgi:hypothetical protein
MEKHKTDESVKAGLKPEGDTNPLKKDHITNSGQDETEEEPDADELVHKQEDTTVTAAADEEQDMDDLVHSVPFKTVRDGDETDPDDLVHEK